MAVTWPHEPAAAALGPRAIEWLVLSRTHAPPLKWHAQRERVSDDNSRGRGGTGRPESQTGFINSNATGRAWDSDCGRWPDRACLLDLLFLQEGKPVQFPQ